MINDNIKEASISLLTPGSYTGSRKKRDAFSSLEDGLIQFYHETGFLFYTIIFTYLTIRFNTGIMSLLVVLGFLFTYTQRKRHRFQRNVRDDIQRSRCVNDETANWMNHFMSRFWAIYEPILSAEMIQIVDAILIENTPSFLDSIRLTTFTLGTKAPKIDSIQTRIETELNRIVNMCMDVKFSFLPSHDLTNRQLLSKVNPKIVMTIRKGIRIPVLLQDVAFIGHLRIKMKLSHQFPYIKTMTCSFLEKPSFEYVLKPVGGGFDIHHIPGLQSFIRDQVHATLEPMMYAPNEYHLDIEGILAGTTDLETANGVLIIKVHSASGLKSMDRLGTLDPYISVNHCRTKHIENNANPKFDETLFVLLNNVDHSLKMEVMDKNTGRTNTLIGTAEFELNSLKESENRIEGLTLPVLRKGKISGEIRCDLHYFNVNKPDKAQDGMIPESNSGILRFTIHACKNLSSSRSIHPYAIFKLNGIEKLRTKVFKRSNNPRWDKSIECFIMDRTKLLLELNILDNAHCIASWSSTEIVQDHHWWNLNENAGKIHISMMWKPVTMSGYHESLHVYRPPIGVVCVNFLSAHNLKNVEAMTGGKSDPYVRIMSGVQNRGQTQHIDDDLNPEWNQVLYVPVHSIRENLIFEVMDYNENTKDKSLGITEFVLTDLIKQVKTNETTIYNALEAVDRTVCLSSMDRKKGRGSLHYSASFYPTKECNKQDEMNHPSGILSVTIQSVSFSNASQHRARVELYLDSHHPQFHTMPMKGQHLDINETGTLFVKEVDFSKLVVNIMSENNKSLGRCVFQVFQIQQRMLQQATFIDGTITLCFSFTPMLDFKLNPKESLENQGNLTVTVVKANDLKAADKNGLSDVFIRFYLDSERIFKTKTYKKTLNPIFNKEERFTVPVLNRLGSKLTAQLYDYDQIGKDTLLGTCLIDMHDIEAFKSVEKAISLDVGSLTVMLLWRPEFIARKRTTLFFSGKESTRMLKKSPSPTKIQDDLSSIDDNYMLNVTIIQAKQLLQVDRSSDPYCRVKIGNKVIYKTKHLKKTLSPDWSESFNCKTTSILDFKVKDHNKLNDIDLGSFHFQVKQYVQHGQAFDGWLPLTPQGQLHVRVAIVDSDVVSIASKSSSSSSSSNRLLGRK